MPVFLFLLKLKLSRYPVSVFEMLLTPPGINHIVLSRKSGFPWPENHLFLLENPGLPLIESAGHLFQKDISFHGKGCSAEYVSSPDNQLSPQAFRRPAGRCGRPDMDSRRCSHRSAGLSCIISRYLFRKSPRKDKKTWLLEFLSTSSIIKTVFLSELPHNPVMRSPRSSMGNCSDMG